MAKYVKRDTAKPESFIEKPAAFLKESVFQALITLSLKELPDEDLQDIENLGSRASTFADDIRRAMEETQMFSYPCKYENKIFPAHDQKVLLVVGGKEKRVDPSLILFARHYLLLDLTAERLRRDYA